jgi:hypothetical protein
MYQGYATQKYGVPQVAMEEVEVIRVPKVETRTETLIKEVPQVQIVERFVEVPEVQIQEKIVELPISLMQEKIVEVPKVQVAELLKQVPRVEIQEIIKEVALPVNEIVEKVRFSTSRDDILGFILLYCRSTIKGVGTRIVFFSGVLGTSAGRYAY